jgi:hypothetical protein
VIDQPILQDHFLPGPIERINRNGIVVEKIRNHNKVAAGCEFICHELAILINPKNIAENDNGIFARIVGGAGNVRVDCRSSVLVMFRGAGDQIIMIYKK